MNFSEKNYPNISSIQHLIELTKTEIATQVATRQPTLTANGGITIDGITIKHTNNLTQARPSQPSLLKTTIDEQGHVTAFTDIGITNAVVENSNAAITSGGVYTALSGKQDTLTFDTQPIENSTNPITSGAVYAALQNIQPSSEPQFTSNVNAISNGFTSGDIGVATPVNE